MESTLVGERGIFRFSVVDRPSVGIRLQREFLVPVDDVWDSMQAESAPLATWLRHPGFEQLELWDSEQRRWTQERFDGWELQTLLQRGRLRLPEACQIALEVAETVGWMHELNAPDGSALGMLYRRLDPTAVVLTEDHRVKIRNPLPLQMQQVVLASNTPVRDSIPYFSPEQVRGLPLGPRTDVYSLAALLFRMLSGREPFRAATPLGVVRKILDTTPPRLGTLVPTPPALEDLVAASLDPDPAKRPGSMRAVIEVLQVVAREGRATWPSTTAAGPPKVLGWFRPARPPST